VQFVGEGMKLFIIFLIWTIAPGVVGQVFSGGFRLVGVAIDHDKHGNPGMVAGIMILVGALISLVIGSIASLIYNIKQAEFRWENTVIDGQRCKFVGTPGGLVTAMILPVILCVCTFGIYAPWAFVKYWSWIYENVEVNGQRGRLTFHGDGAALLGTYILGAILTACTFYIYGAWFANDLFAFYWENSKIDGRNFTFRKDPGGFLGTWIINIVLTICTFGFYFPWATCNIIKWESERVA
jgi:uncharacterized membrane protein YjgN (DUF898 family)